MGPSGHAVGGTEKDMRSSVAPIAGIGGVLDLIVHWVVQNRRPAIVIGLAALVALVIRILPAELWPPRGPDPSACLAAPIDSPEIESPGMPGPKFGITKTVSSTVVEMPCSGPGQKYGVR